MYTERGSTNCLTLPVPGKSPVNLPGQNLSLPGQSLSLPGQGLPTVLSAPGQQPTSLPVPEQTRDTSPGNHISAKHEVGRNPPPPSP